MLGEGSVGGGDSAGGGCRGTTASRAGGIRSARRRGVEETAEAAEAATNAGEDRQDASTRIGVRDAVGEASATEVGAAAVGTAAVGAAAVGATAAARSDGISMASDGDCRAGARGAAACGDANSSDTVDAESGARRGVVRYSTGGRCTSGSSGEERGPLRGASWGGAGERAEPAATSPPPSPAAADSWAPRGASSSALPDAALPPASAAAASAADSSPASLSSCNSVTRTRVTLHARMGSGPGKPACARPTRLRARSISETSRMTSTSPRSEMCASLAPAIHAAMFVDPHPHAFLQSVRNVLAGNSRATSAPSRSVNSSSTA